MIGKQALIKQAQSFTNALFAHGEIHELRVLFGGGGLVYSALYDDPDALALAAVEANELRHGAAHAQGIYVTVNPALDELRARELNGPLRRAGRGELVSDAMISHRIAFLVDVDAIKPIGTSSTDSERAEAIDLTCDIAKWLQDEHGWPAPILGSSGNGGHLVYPIHAPNDDDTLRLFKAGLAMIKRVFDADTRGDVDVRVCNASRIWKMPGTIARKGDHYIDAANPEMSRPHREALLMDVPIGEPPLTIAQLKRLVAKETTAEPLFQRHAAEAPTSAWEEMSARAMSDLGWVEHALGAINGSDYNDWIGVGGLLLELLGERGLDLFDAWSSRQGGYKGREDVARKWRQLRAKNAPEDAMQHLLKLARQGGWLLKDWLAPPARKGSRPNGPPGRGQGGATGDDGVPQWTFDTTQWRASMVGTMAKSVHARTPHLHHERAGVPYLDLEGQHGHYGPLALWECLTETDGDLPVPPLLKDGMTMMRWDLTTRTWQPCPMVAGQKSPAICAQLQHAWHRRFPTKVIKEEGRQAQPLYYRTGRAFGPALLTMLEHWPEEEPHGVAFLDTWVSVESTRWQIKKERLRAHHYALTRFDFDLDVALSQSRPATRWDAFVRGFFDPGTDDYEDRVEFLKRWLALALFGVSVAAQAPALFLKGNKGCGKGELIRLLMALIPKVASVQPQQWDNDQMRGQLLGAHLNVYDDLPSTPIKDAATFKSIIFGGAVSYKIVYQATGTFSPRAAHLFTCNEMPTIPGADSATEDRLITLRVDGASKRGTDSDVAEYHRVLLAEERDAIVADLYQALERWVADRLSPREGIERGFKIPSSSREEMQARQALDNAHNAWLEEATIIDDGIPLLHSTTVDSAYRQYVSWARQAGYAHPGTRKLFKMRLEHQGIKASRQRTGIVLEHLLVVINTVERSEGNFASDARTVQESIRIAADNGLKSRLEQLGIDVVAALTPF